MATRAHGIFPLLDLPRLPCSPRRMPSRTVNGKASCPKHSGLNLQVSPPLSPHQLRLISRDPEQHGSRDGGPTSSNVINNFLDPNDPTSSEARQSRMHFFDNQRKVDYVLVYHYRNRGGQPVQGSSSGNRAPLAVISNGEMGKEPNASRQEDMMIEMGPQDALEEERKEQREEFEYNLMEAGLELEKDLEKVALEH